MEWTLAWDTTVLHYTVFESYVQQVSSLIPPVCSSARETRNAKLHGAVSTYAVMDSQSDYGQVSAHVTVLAI